MTCETRQVWGSVQRPRSQYKEAHLKVAHVDVHAGLPGQLELCTRDRQARRCSSLCACAGQGGVTTIGRAVGAAAHLCRPAGRCLCTDRDTHTRTCQQHVTFPGFYAPGLRNTRTRQRGAEYASCDEDTCVRRKATWYEGSVRTLPAQRQNAAARSNCLCSVRRCCIG